jgi:hypothetical protein
MCTVYDGIPELARLSRLRTSRSGRSPDWLKMKNADAPAVKREWGRLTDDDLDVINVH